MTPDILEWGHAHIGPEDVYNLRVLEVGACDVNGSLAPHIKQFAPLSYISTDIELTQNIDELVRAEDLVARYGYSRFDLVVSTEMLEHTYDWQECLWNMMAVTKPGGVVILTTRSPGFGYHGYPGDHWRFTEHEMLNAFLGWDIEDIRPDPGTPGIFVRARRPLNRDWDADAEHERMLSITAHRQPQPRQM